MSKSSKDGPVNLAVPAVLVVVISLIAALAASTGRPQQSQTSVEALVHAEAALKRTGMP